MVGKLHWKHPLLPAAVSKCTAAFLKELANHGWLAAATVMRVSTVVTLFAETMHEIPLKERKRGED